MSRNPKQSKSSLPFVIIGGGVGALVPPPPSNAKPGANPVQPSRAPQPGASSPWTKGSATARVTLEEFSDFQCPACGTLEPGLRRVLKDYGDRVNLIFRNFPLAMHRYAFQASRAAEAAGQQGKFWEMHDMLYDNQNEGSESMEPRVQFDSYASRLGLDVQRFKTDMERQDLADRVKADYGRGMSLNVKGTPTIFLNGRELVPGQLVTEEILRREIDAALGSMGK